MKLLLDACVAGLAREVLEGAGHDVECVGAWTKDPGDDEILRCADAAGRILITLDKDFGELAIVHRRPHHGIVVSWVSPPRIRGRPSTRPSSAMGTT